MSSQLEPTHPSTHPSIFPSIPSPSASRTQSTVPAYPPSRDGYYKQLPQPIPTGPVSQIEPDTSHIQRSGNGYAHDATTYTASGSHADAIPDWGEAPEASRKLSRWEEKVQGDLAGWRGGHGVPRSGVPSSGVPSSSYFGQPATGTIGRDLPKEIVRIERDWSEGDVCQFATVFPLELESRISPSAFTTFIDDLNKPLMEAYSTRGAVIDNLIAIATWWTSLFWRTSHFESEMRKVEEIIRTANEKTFNPAGLNVLSPRFVALQYLEIEYY